MANACAVGVPNACSSTSARFSRKWGGIAHVKPMPPSTWIDARAFSTDALARSVAARAIAEGRDRRIEQGMRSFMYLPFEHSEDMADQERSIALFEPLGADSLKWAVLHADIIRKFGRFPHRNAVLGRATTPDEAAFLDEGGFKG